MPLYAFTLISHIKNMFASSLNNFCLIFFAKVLKRLLVYTSTHLLRIHFDNLPPTRRRLKLYTGCFYTLSLVHAGWLAFVFVYRRKFVWNCNFETNFIVFIRRFSLRLFNRFRCFFQPFNTLPSYHFFFCCLRKLLLAFGWEIDTLYI